MSVRTHEATRRPGPQEWASLTTEEANGCPKWRTLLTWCALWLAAAFVLPLPEGLPHTAAGARRRPAPLYAQHNSNAFAALSPAAPRTHA